MFEVGVLRDDEEDGGASAHKSGLDRWLGYRFVPLPPTQFRQFELSFSTTPLTRSNRQDEVHVR
jgi:hypothetical protein